jgi:transcription factor C subunit 3
MASNQNAIAGSISQDTYQDAVLLLEDMDANDSDWHEWPLIATDGDCAAIVQLVSENKVNDQLLCIFFLCVLIFNSQVNFRIDTSIPQAARPALDWNSKKAGW